MGDIFEGIDISELAGSDEPVVPGVQSAEAGGAKQGEEGVQSSKEAIQKGGEEQQREPEEDPNAIDINELAEQGSVEEEETTEKDSKTSSQTPTETKSTQSPSSQSDATTSLASALAEVGVFSSLTEEEIGEITDAETMIAAVRKQTEANRYSDLSEEQKTYLNALKEGVPERKFHEHTANADQYKRITDANIEGNEPMIKELIKRSLIVKGVDTATATEMADIQFGKEDAKARAIAARDSLVAYEQGLINDEIASQKTERINKENAEKEALITLKAKIQQDSEILPGIKVNTNTKDKIFTSMTTAVKDSDNGSPLNELMVKYQEDPEFRYKLHAMYEVTKGLTDFKKFKSSAKSNAVNELDKKLKSGQGTRTGSHSAGASGGRTAAEIANDLPSSF